MPIELRTFRASDLDGLHAIYGDPEVMRHVDGGVLDRVATRAALEDHIATDRWLAVLDRDDLLGEVGFTPLGDETEMGWTFRRDAWGGGLATEAGRLAL